MAEPSANVAPPLLAHIHLVSNLRFPVIHHFGPEDALKKLIEAPSVVKDQAPMTWMFLEAPPDGTILLVWQASQLGNNFASDGYVWADAEAGRTLNIGNITIEAWHHQCGFVYGRDQIAAHARFRYRIVNSADPNIAFDPSLWIVHYTASEPNRRLQAGQIPINQQTSHTLSIRRHLHSQGQLIRKEFMLHDRSNWPTINVPGGRMPGPQQMAHMHPGMNRPGPGYYPGAHPNAPPGAVGPSPSKRQRQVGPAHMAGGPVAQPGIMPPPHPHNIFDDETDVALGDLLDFLTPREISLMRYRQHHEWMEELLSSPFEIHQIMPVDLGLGLRGPLATLTDGVCDPPPESISDVRVSGQLKTHSATVDKERLQEFEKRVQNRLENDRELIERLEKRHAKRMAKLKGTNELKTAEKALRKAVDDPESSIGPSYWHTFDNAPSASDRQTKALKDTKATSTDPASAKDTPDSSTPTATSVPPARIADIVSQVESLTGRKINQTTQVNQVEKGGWQSPPPVPESPPAPEEQDIPMGNTDIEGVGAGDTDMGLDEMDDLEAGGDDDKMQGTLDATTAATATGGANDLAMDRSQAALDVDTGLGDDFDVGGTDFAALMEDTVAGADDNGGDLDMHNSAAGLLDEYYTSSPASPAVGTMGTTTATAATSSDNNNANGKNNGGDNANNSNNNNDTSNKSHNSADLLQAQPPADGRDGHESSTGAGPFGQGVPDEELWKSSH